ncbi:MAG: threonylcarbamoyl-AMP synthase [Bacteroidetes bacterium]|nr:MAG: threonylcarbamoyl-AMP synthase [Bacteroidota bacterium]
MAEFIRIYEENPNPKEIDKVVSVLKKGGLIIFPTDTVYGLGCDITNIKALERVAQIKGVKLEKSNFSFICHDLSNLSDYVKQIDSSTFKLLKRALPGPYTFILPSAKSLPNPFKKKKTVGIRVPNNNIAIEIVKKLGRPIISTSIRDEDEIIEYTTDPELIKEKWDNLVELVIDGGYGDNEPSTIIDVSDGEPVIIREGKGSLDIL